MSKVQDAGRALDVLHRASSYIRKQWDVNMRRREAKSNLDARAILFNCSNVILIEHGIGITKAEVEGAAIIEREMR